MTSTHDPDATIYAPWFVEGRFDANLYYHDWPDPYEPTSPTVLDSDGQSSSSAHTVEYIRDDSVDDGPLMLRLSFYVGTPSLPLIEPDPSHTAECMARHFLRVGSFFEDQLSSLWDLLPHDSPRGHQTLLDGGFSFTTGAFQAGGLVGVRSNALQMPWVTALLCRIVHSVLLGEGAEDYHFTSLTLLRNVHSGIHRDGNNHPSCNNLLIPLSRFSGGELWCYNAASGDVCYPGTDLPGLAHAVTPPFLEFDSRELHGTLHWTGVRVILAVFHMKTPEDLSDGEMQFLRQDAECEKNAVNQAWTVMERIGLRALDEITWACMALMRASLGRREVFFRKSDGSVLSGPLHSYWQQDTRRCSPVLKTTDLRSAYKQFAIRPEHHRMCVVTLKDPADGLTKGFVCRVLPFGALASVGQFNRFSRLWQRILWELKLAAASYFDDFPSVEVRALAENHDSSVKAALRLFGVDWASDKDLPFSQTADVLGVRLDATDTEGGVLRVRNKPERSKEIASSIDKILADGCIDPKQIPSLFGRIQFSESQLMGRQGRLALAQIRWLSSARHRHVLSSLDATVFRSLRERMLEGRPREIQVLPVGGQTLVFTDGACDKLGDKFSCSIGGVMYRVLPTGSYETRAFGCYLDESVVEQWAGLGKRHLIGPTELFAVVAARRPDMSGKIF
ncbi:unnamed protein product [Symbiodinium sp. CCMP2592]|nr:unnamed protein product [Symbiodinium sp. CCMP2592]